MRKRLKLLSLLTVSPQFEGLTTPSRAGVRVRKLTNSVCSGACIIQLGIEGGPRAYEKPIRGMYYTFNEVSRIEH